MAAFVAEASDVFLVKVVSVGIYMSAQAAAINTSKVRYEDITGAYSLRGNLS